MPLTIASKSRSSGGLVRGDHVVGQNGHLILISCNLGSLSGCHLLLHGILSQDHKILRRVQKLEVEKFSHGGESQKRAKSESRKSSIFDGSGADLEPKWQAVLANEMYCGHIVCNPQTPCKTKLKRLLLQLWYAVLQYTLPGLLLQSSQSSLRMIDGISGCVQGCAVWQIAYIVDEDGTGQGGSLVGR